MTDDTTTTTSDVPPHPATFIVCRCRECPCFLTVDPATNETVCDNCLKGYHIPDLPDRDVDDAA